MTNERLSSFRIAAATLAIASLITTVSTSARADDEATRVSPSPSPPSPPSPPEADVPSRDLREGSALPPDERRRDVLVTAGLGYFSDREREGGVLSVTALHQRGPIGFGATFEYGGAVFDYTHVTAAPMIGVFRPGRA